MPFMGIPFGVCEAGGQVPTVDPGIDAATLARGQLARIPPQLGDPECLTRHEVLDAHRAERRLCLLASAAQVQLIPVGADHECHLAVLDRDYKPQKLSIEGHRSIKGAHEHYR